MRATAFLWMADHRIAQWWTNRSARSPFYQLGYVAATTVDVAMFYVYTQLQGAFSVRFAEHGVNHWKLFAPDMMHEYELGVWKAILIHLLRILYAEGGDAIQELDERYADLLISTKQCGPGADIGDM